MERKIGTDPVLKHGNDHNHTKNPIGSAVGDLAKEGVAQAKELGTRSIERVVKEAEGWRRTVAKKLDAAAWAVDEAASKAGLGPLGDKLAAGASRAVRAVSQNIEERTPREMLESVKRGAQQQPGLFMVGCVALGFLVARLIRN